MNRSSLYLSILLSMSRPRQKRMVFRPPVMEGFKPFGIPMADLEPVILLFEEYEAIRLLDYQGMTQLEAAREMAVSRPTLTRIYEKARRTLAEAFVEGKAIFIAGGNFHTDEYWYRCEECHKILIGDKELRECTVCQSDNIRMLSDQPLKADKERQENRAGFCICLSCNTRIPHLPGAPCKNGVCPRCGKPMIRENSYHHLLYKKKMGL